MGRRPTPVRKALLHPCSNHHNCRCHPPFTLRSVQEGRLKLSVSVIAWGMLRHEHRQVGKTDIGVETWLIFPVWLFRVCDRILLARAPYAIYLVISPVPTFCTDRDWSRMKKLPLSWAENRYPRPDIFIPSLLFVKRVKDWKRTATLRVLEKQTSTNIDYTILVQIDYLELLAHYIIIYSKYIVVEPRFL